MTFQRYVWPDLSVVVRNTKLALLLGLPMKVAIAYALTSISTTNASATRFGLYRKANIAIGRLITGTINTAKRPLRPLAIASA